MAFETNSGASMGGREIFQVGTRPLASPRVVGPLTGEEYRVLVLEDRVVRLEQQVADLLIFIHQPPFLVRLWRRVWAWFS